MARNRGATSLRLKRRSSNPMQDYDRLPPELRAWLATAALPWRPKSALRAFRSAVARTSDPQKALGELDNLQARLIAKDARKVWGRAHPAANTSETA